jgi:hypothetical protein
LFRQGKELMSRGRYAEACAAFDASQKLDPALATLLNQASCREKNSQFATAWGLWLEAARQTRNATDDAGRQMRKTATEHAAKLEPRLSTLTIVVSGENKVGGLEVLRDDDAIDPGAWNRALPVDGGSYKITARAPGNTAWTTTVTIGVERDAATVETPRLRAAELGNDPDTAGVKPTGPTTARRDRKAPPSPSPVTRRPRLIPLALGGGALLLGATAIGFELSSSSVYDRAKREPNNAVQDDLWHTANTRRYVAEGFGIAGLACAGAAVWLYLRSAPEPVESSGLSLAPMVGDGRAGLVLGGRY